MTRDEINALLDKKNNEALEAHSEIVSIQKGEGNILKTGQDHLDYFLIGGLSNKMVFIGSRPAQGKTYNCESLIRNLLDPVVNPDKSIKILRLNLEMQTRSLLLRDLRKSLGKKMRDILSNEYTMDERVVVNSVVKRLNDERVINFSHALEGEDFRYLLQKFCDDNPDKEKVVLIDHLHIYSSKKVIDEILTICNEMKMAYKNLSFVIYFQLNRDLEKVWRGEGDKKGNPANFLPHSGHIYETDKLMFYSDLIMGIVIPQVVGLEEYASVYKDRNQHLKEHFSEDLPGNVTVRLKGRNRVYYNYIKVRLMDDWEDPTLYCSIINDSVESTLAQEVKSPLEGIPSFNTSTLIQAQGSGFESDPF